MTVTVTELSNYLGITERRIQDLVKDGFMKKEEHGTYDLKTCIQNYISYKTMSRASADLTEARIEKLNYEAQIKKLELELKSGKVVELATLEKDLNDIATTLSNKLYSLSSRLSQKLKLGAEVIDAIDKEVEELLLELKDNAIYKDY